MPTSIKNRKTPHAKSLGLTVEDLVPKIRTKYKRVLDFMDPDDIYSPPTLRYVPISRIYVSSGKQEIPDDVLKNSDLRNCTTEYWNARCVGWRKYGKFMTEWEYKQFSKKTVSTIDSFLQ